MAISLESKNNKSPYKAHLGVWMSAGAKGANRSGYYVHIEKGASFIAGGFYSPDPEDLKKVRKVFFYTLRTFCFSI